MKVKLIVLSVVLVSSIIFNVFLGIMYFQSQNQNTDLTSERDTLKTEISTLVTERDEAKTEVEELSALNNGLISSNDVLQNERDALKGQVYDLTHERDDALSLVEDLNGEVQQLRAGNVMSKLGMYDNRDNPQQPYIHVYGFVWNVGTQSVYNCKIQVSGKQGDVVAVNTYIDVETLSGYEINPHTSIEEIDEKVYYTGTPLTDMKVTIEYD